MEPTQKESLKDIKPYKQGESSIAGKKRVIKLSSNELPYPPSAAAIEAFQNTELTLGRYPDGGQSELRAAIAAIHHVPAENVFAGNGSEEAIGLVIRAVLTAGEEIVISENSFIMAEIYARGVGGEIITCAERDYRVDVDAMITAVTNKTRIVYLCTPNNPTGTYSTIEEITRLAAALPEHVVLILDAAYAEFVDAQDYDCGLSSLFDPLGRVIVTHTFSKAYGLAAQRIGWAAVPNGVMDAVSRIRTPFNTNTAGLNAATAAIWDQSTLYKNVARIIKTRGRFTLALTDLGINVVPSQTNFVLLTFKEGGDEARHLDSVLQEAGILGRPVSGGTNEFRISIGTDDEISKTLEVITNWVRKRNEKAA